METEKRVYGVQELRTVDTKEKIIEGHAVVFNQQTVIADSFIEIISSGAFTGCDLSDVCLFVNHNQEAIPLARTTSSTLQLTIDNVGLAFRAKLDTENNPDAKALYHSIARGDLRGCSFAFTVAEDGDEWQNLNSDMPTRIIHKFKKFFEISCVSFPAYPQTDLQARARQMITNARKETNRMTNYDRELLLKHGFDPDEKDEDEWARNLTIARYREADYVNEERKRAREPQPPQYIPGIGFINNPYEEKRFIPIHEGGEMNSAIVTRQVEAGRDLKDRRTVESTFNVFGEKRSMKLQPDSGQATLVVPQYSAANVVERFKPTSSLAEAVAHLSLMGGEEFSQPYIKEIQTGGHTKEGEDYHEAETIFDYAKISRTKITAYAELTEELEKLPAAAYADTVFQNIRTSILKVLNREILFGEGISDNESQLVGIFSQKATAINPDTDLELSTITDTTLNEILFNYGGEEELESPSVLIVSKYDLLGFANVRTSTKQNFYDIQYSGNGAGGTINGVPFIINSECKPLTSADTQSGDYCMAYGNLANYLLCEFSPLEVRRSDDFKFRRGITAFRGSAIVGGNVVKANGFIRVKKQ